MLARIIFGVIDFAVDAPAKHETLRARRIEDQSLQFDLLADRNAPRSEDRSSLAPRRLHRLKLRSPVRKIRQFDDLFEPI